MFSCGQRLTAIWTDKLAQDGNDFENPVLKKTTDNTLQVAFGFCNNPCVFQSNVSGHQLDKIPNDRCCCVSERVLKSEFCSLFPTESVTILTSKVATGFTARHLIFPTNSSFAP